MQTLLGVFRQPNTTTASQPFDQATINAVWEKGRIVPGYDASRYRKDACGAWIIPVARGGADIVANLQPFHWQNNRHKGDHYPHWTCALSARA